LAPDAERIKRLESLGYVARVSAREIPAFDKSKPDPKDLILLHAQAVKITTLTSRKRFKEARSLCEKALEEYPESAYFHHRLGNIALELGDVEEAIVHFSKSISLAADNSGPGAIYDAHHLLTQAYFRSKRYDDAIVHLRKALQIAPKNIHLLSDIALALSKVGRLEEAVKHWREALGVDPAWVISLNNLAWHQTVHKRAKFYDPHEAVNLAQRACEVTEYKKSYLLDTLAVAYAAAGRFAEAVETAEKALKLARSARQDNLAAQLQSRLNLFKRRQAYHEDDK
jgi:Flp pilus assembly protein TadD